MPEDNYCCENCFNNIWLQMMIRENRSHFGCCFYCGARGWLAPVQILYAGFSNLLTDYIPPDAANGGGDSYFQSVPPLEAMQRDWKPFTDHFIAKNPTHFLPAVFKNKPLPCGLTSFAFPVVAFHRNAMSTAYDKWLEFWIRDDSTFFSWIERQQPLHLNTLGTFFHQASIHLQNYIQRLPSGKKLWRARADYLGFDDWDCRALPLGDMGAHPAFPSSRLNRDGEAVLYCAEAERTAVAEVRPGRGYLCTTCELTLGREIHVLDLASPLEEINPFTCSNLSWKLDCQRVVRNLSRLIAKPLSRGEDKTVYLRPQF